MDPAAAARRWADTWTRAWPQKDADAIAALYAEGATYRSSPFRDPHPGAREYVESVFPTEEQIECWFGDPVVSDLRAAVEWWATYLEGGERMTLAGTTILRYDAAGLVTEHVDYWLEDKGRREPPPGWGT
jgi:hypothetical protein